MKIENFMQALKEYQSPLVFNPWRDYDPKCDISSDAPVIRAANLTRYLQLRQKAALFIYCGRSWLSGRPFLGNGDDFRTDFTGPAS